MIEGVLSPCESKYASAVIEEAVQRLAVLSSITPDILMHRDELAQMVGEEISSIIEQQRVLEEKYEELISRRNELRSLSNKTKYKENQREIEEVARELRQATKVLCRNLKENPNVSENLVKIQTERSSIHATLSKTLRELKEDHFQTLLALVTDQQMRQDHLTQTIQKEKEAGSAVKGIQKELQKEIELREEQVTRCNQDINRLKEELADIKTRTAIDTRYMRREAEARAEAQHRGFTVQTDALEHQLDDLTFKMKEETEVNRDTEDFLNRKQAALRQQIQDWISKYDSDMEELEKELETLKNNRAKALNRMATLTEQLQECETYVKTEEERREKIEEDNRLKKKQASAALLVQTWWRMVCAKKIADRLRNKKKKKGKKGKSSPRKKK
eukprot:GCRY01001459.1.p1 GENE.GCRY01001459.1~~GCRY01001459.1.p1  ORF type:complete len:388 (-),score=70.83 GCRY01001459.1:461-1624(-)